MVATLRHNATADERIAHADFARQAGARHAERIRAQRVPLARRLLARDRQEMVLRAR